MIGPRPIIPPPFSLEAARAGVSMLGDMEHQTPGPGRVLLAEALGMFGVSYQVWRAWRRKGWVPEGVKGAGIGSPVTFDRAALERLLPELGPVGPAYPDPRQDDARYADCWRVQLNKDGRKIADAYFEDEVEAAKAYDRAAWGAYGPEAFLNFPEDYGQVRGGTGEHAAKRAA